MIKVKVPATSANMGPGFDCMGLALQIYNTIEVEELEEGLEINILDDTKELLFADSRNLVYQSMKIVFEKMNYTPKGLRINLVNSIPITRGLGSSSACIVGGLFAANALMNNPLSTEELLRIAAQEEGHPDNSTPAILGGLAVAVLDKNDLYYVRKSLPDTLKFGVFIPAFTLSTKKARNVFPTAIPHEDGVFNAGRAALMAASMLMGDYSNLRIAVEDRLHQPYRQELIPGMQEIFEKSTAFGAKGVYLSGAGPTLVAIVDEDTENFESVMGDYIKNKLSQWTFRILKPDNNGVQISYHG